MNKSLERRHDAHTRANSVCEMHTAIFDATAGGKKARASLAANVANVTELLVSQQKSFEDRRAATVQSRAARVRLREAAKAVVSVGKLVNLPEIAMSTMRLPGSMSDDELLAYARTLLDRASAHADAFLAEGLPPDLLENLEGGIKALSAAREQFALARQQFAGASEAIRETQDQSDRTVRVLEAIALNTPAARPEVLTKLRVAKRVGPRKAAEKTPAAAPPAASTTPSSTPQ